MRIPNMIEEYQNIFNSFEFIFDNNQVSLYMSSRNKTFEISFENMKDIISENSVTKTKIIQPLIAVELNDGSYYFASRSNETYKEAFSESSVSIKNLSCGDEIILQNGQRGFFIGSFYEVYTWGGSSASKVRKAMIRTAGGYICEFISKDIYDVSGFDQRYADIYKNATELGENYCPTMVQVREYVKDNNLILE